MHKRLFYLVLFVSVTAFAQHHIKGTLKTSEKYPWMLAYKLNGSKQDFVTYDSIKQGKFNLKIDSNRGKGMYRLIYDMQNQGYLDVFYDKEDIELSFEPNNPESTLNFSQSKNNILYRHYLATITPVQNKLDSLQLSFFSTPDDQNTKEAYAKELKLYKAIQQQFVKDADGLFIQDFIRSSEQFYNDRLYTNPEAYITNTQKHFFDFSDVNNTTLASTTFIHDKINEFIFRMNTSDDATTQKNLRKKAIAITIDKLQSNPTLSQDIQEGLLYNFAQAQDVEMTQYVLGFYTKLPAENQDTAFVNDIKGQLRTAVGNMAPEITWIDKGVQKSLLKLKGVPNYLVVFWSSTCGHCLKELPLLKEYLKSKPEVSVIAVGLETEVSKQGWTLETKKYPNWTHVYGKNKWKNKYAKEYGVSATPSFYVLDAQKKIVAKPNDVKELKKFFE